MTDERIKEAIAPCGLCCETCFAHVDGEIRKYSKKLKEKLQLKKYCKHCKKHILHKEVKVI